MSTASMCTDQIRSRPRASPRHYLAGRRELPADRFAPRPPHDPDRDVALPCRSDCARTRAAYLVTSTVGIAYTLPIICAAICPRVIAYRTARGVIPSIPAAANTLTRSGRFVVMISSCRVPAWEMYAGRLEESKRKIIPRIGLRSKCFQRHRLRCRKFSGRHLRIRPLRDM